MSILKARNVENVSKLPLTARQREALEFIRKCVRKRGYGPTVREIGDQMGIHSPNGVVGHLVALERKGFIQREANLSRSIMLLERGDRNLCGIRIAARVESGKILENPQPDERLDISEKIQLSGEDFFLLQAADGSLNEAYGIHRGDYLLLRRARNAAEGETAIIRDFSGELHLTTCRFDPISARTELLSTAGEPRRFDNACSGIYGVLVALLRLDF